MLFVTVQFLSRVAQLKIGSAATLARIFGPFFMTKPVDEGTGRGLSVLHGIVHGHEGATVVDGEPGVGSTFTIQLSAVQRTSPTMLSNHVRIGDESAHV